MKAISILAAFALAEAHVTGTHQTMTAERSIHLPSRFPIGVRSHHCCDRTISGLSICTDLKWCFAVIKAILAVRSTVAWVLRVLRMVIVVRSEGKMQVVE